MKNSYAIYDICTRNGFHPRHVFKVGEDAIIEELMVFPVEDLRASIWDAAEYIERKKHLVEFDDMRGRYKHGQVINYCKKAVDRLDNQ